MHVQLIRPLGLSIHLIRNSRSTSSSSSSANGGGGGGGGGAVAATQRAAVVGLGDARSSGAPSCRDRVKERGAASHVGGCLTGRGARAGSGVVHVCLMMAA